jgi:hypothetical protein
MLASKHPIHYPTTHIKVICHLAETALLECLAINQQLSSPAHQHDELLYERASLFMDKEQTSLQRFRCYIESWCSTPRKCVITEGASPSPEAYLEHWVPSFGFMEVTT